MFKHAPTALRPVAALALLGLLSACSRAPESGDGSAPAATAGDQSSAAQSVAADAAPKPAVAATVQAMGVDDLRASASKALAENRIYAPGGDNAMEYYLALRDKQPDDAASTSALTDLMPYTVIAAEQSITRKDFAEAKRLQALIAKSDPHAPALPRLGDAISSGEKLLAQQATEDADKAKLAAEAREAQRQAAQAAQQKQAAEALAAQQAQAERAAASRAEAARQAAAPAVRQPTQAPTTPAATPTPPPAVVAAPASSGERRILSAPPPRYPMDALRANTSGQVVVEISIGGDGEVTDARVVQATPARVFDRAALTAVKRWKFEPTGANSTTRRTIAFNPG